MAAGTTSVSPVGQSGSFNIFSYVGSQLMKASDRAARTRRETDKRIAELEAKIEEDGDDINPEDEEELASLTSKRAKKGYFFTKALESQATDKIKTTIGKFQRNPNLGFDPAASETERFKATANIMRPGSMPDTSDRQQPTDKVAMVGKGFKLVLSALENLQSKVAELVQSAKGRRQAQKTTVEAIDTLTQSAKEQTETQKDLTKIQRSELDVQNATMDAYMDVQNDKEREAEQAEIQAIEGEGAGNLNVKEVGQGSQYEEEVRDTNTDISGGNPLMRPSPEGNAAGVTMGQRSVPNINQVSANYGMQPPAPRPAWGPDAKMSSGGMAKPYQRQKLSNGGATFYNNPTNIKLSGGAMALPINRNTGREAIGGGAGFARKTSDITKSTELFQRAGAGTAFATMAQISDANPFMGPIMQTAIPSLQPIAKGYGFPPSMLDGLFKGGKKASISMPSMEPEPPTSANRRGGAGTTSTPLRRTPRNLPGNGKIIRGAIVTQRNDDDGEQTGSDIAVPGDLGDYGVGAKIQNPFQKLKITGTGTQIEPDGSGFGKWVSGETTIDGKKYELLVGHLDTISVVRDDVLGPGAKIGTQGMTGSTTGPHVTTHINALDGGNPHIVLKSVENAWQNGTIIKTDGGVSNTNISPAQVIQIPEKSGIELVPLNPDGRGGGYGRGGSDFSVNRTTMSPQSNMGLQLAVVMQPPRIIRPQKKAPATTPRSLDASASAILDMNYGGVSI